MKKEPDEILPIVDSSGKVISKDKRENFHNGSKILHPVIHLHIFNEFGHIILQKRANDKKIQPGKWDTSVGGHIEFGETKEKALRREAFEEVGLKNTNFIFLNNYIYENDIERELIYIYFSVLKSESSLRLSNEVTEIKAFSSEKINELIKTEKTTPNFIYEYKNHIVDAYHL